MRSNGFYTFILGLLAIAGPFIVGYFLADAKGVTKVEISDVKINDQTSTEKTDTFLVSYQIKNRRKQYVHVKLNVEVGKGVFAFKDDIGSSVSKFHKVADKVQEIFLKPNEVVQPSVELIHDKANDEVEIPRSSLFARVNISAVDQK